MGIAPQHPPTTTGRNPHQPRIYCRQLSRSWLLVRLWQLRHISRTFVLNRSRLAGAASICRTRFSRNPRNLRSQTLPTPLLVAFTCSRSCFSIHPCVSTPSPVPPPPEIGSAHV